MRTCSKGEGSKKSKREVVSLGEDEWGLRRLGEAKQAGKVLTKRR